MAARQPLGQMLATLEHVVLDHTLLQELAPALQQRLRDTLAVLHPRQEVPPDSGQLKAQVDQSGMNYEANVHNFLTGHTASAEAVATDLKGQLLELAHTLQQASQTGAGEPSTAAIELLRHVERAVDNIELHQMANEVARQEHQPFLIPLVLPFASAAYPAQLVVHRHPREGQTSQTGEDTYTAVLLLDVSALGPLRVEATLRGAMVSATISSPEQAVVDWLHADAPALSARLHALGVQTVVTCEVRQQHAADTETALSRLWHLGPERLVDVKI
jgi:hypothetical protein